MPHFSWIYPVGCDSKCRNRLENFLKNLENDLDNENKLVIVYITDVGSNKRTLKERMNYDNYRLKDVFNENVRCVGRDNISNGEVQGTFYLPFYARTVIEPWRLYYRIVKGDSGGNIEEKSFTDLYPRLVGRGVYTLFPEPCIYLRIGERENNNDLNCFSFGDNDVDEYVVMLKDIPSSYNYDVRHGEEDVKRTPFHIGEMIIPDNVEIYMLFSTTCLRRDRAVKYIIGGYKVSSLHYVGFNFGHRDFRGGRRWKYMQEVARVLEEVLNTIRSVSSSKGTMDLFYRLIATEDMYTLLYLFNIYLYLNKHLIPRVDVGREALVDYILDCINGRLQFVISLGNTDTGFFGAYFMDNPVYTHIRVRSKQLEDKVNRYYDTLAQRLEGPVDKYVIYRELVKEKFTVLPKPVTNSERDNERKVLFP